MFCERKTIVASSTAVACINAPIDLFSSRVDLRNGGSGSILCRQNMYLLITGYHTASCKTLFPKAVTLVKCEKP